HAIGFTQRLSRNKIPVDLVFTIDPIIRFPIGKPGTINEKIEADAWYNYFQRSDTHTLRFGGLLRLQGSAADFATNKRKEQEISADELQKAVIPDPPFNEYAPADRPPAGHVFIMGVKAIQDSWLEQLEKVIEKGKR